MSRWKQWIKEPKGALPGGIITKAGIALIGVLVAGMLFSSSLTGPEEDPMAPAPPEARAVDERAGRAFEGRLRAEAERHAQQAAADDARADRERRQAEAETAGAGGDSGAGSGERGAGGGGDGAAGMVQAEHELREALRLEEIERRTRSLRSLPVARTYRDPNEARDAARRLGRSPSRPRPRSTRCSRPSDNPSPPSRRRCRPGWRAKDSCPARRGAPRAAHLRAPPARRSRASASDRWTRRAGNGSARARSSKPCCLTQLSGEFPGPVLAMVSVPLYSADRQRVLIPRGARVVGTARAVQDRDQSRLAVAFHRLLLPDGGWIDLEFAGLNQAGEGALKDQVGRHYFSTFAAAGAVGALSGLTLAGASPYGLRAGVGQGLGNSATSVLDRFLNRMPEITVRAGHRLRIWFTSDALVPTPLCTPMTRKDSPMHHRILVPALLLPFLTLASPAPASAQFDFGSWFQRAQMIANQITQISNQVSQIRSMARQLSELEDQLDHMERAARGEIDALLAPFSRLAAEPVGLVRDGLAWGSDFQGAARETVDAVRDFGRGGRSFTGLWRTAQSAADRVSEADILALFRDHPPEAAARAAEDYRRAREAADRQRVLDYATLDAAAALAETIESAQGSFSRPDRERQSLEHGTPASRGRCRAEPGPDQRGRGPGARASGRPGGEPGAAGRTRAA